ncbi:uncharacterized protein LOC123228438 [Mangifera indica]|uniref:uncharacterized protein LOC123228438 n=1 Tax=Mangifera indica TaxID=29780 RepID=UPI001CF9E683|nr:uncharacterized protein LOC123228438 [Mangifera indica]
MKASLKFREDQKPLLRAKVPLSILGLPFQSGIIAGESKELTLNLSTFFESGPSVRIAYRPNDTWNPFSMVVKTGTGPFGSPISSPILMSAEFNLLGRGNPSFMLHFKPQFGDFSIKKSQSSLLRSKSGAVLEENDSSIEVVESPMLKKLTISPSKSAADFAGFLSGIEMAARTTLPVKSRAILNFRWGVRVPADTSVEPTAGINFKRIPFLVMNKIGIEHVDGGDSKGKNKDHKKQQVIAGQELGLVGNSNMAELCFNVKRQLEILQGENGLLKKALDDLRQEIVYKNPSPTRDLNPGRRSNEKRLAVMEEDGKEELKKALKAQV